MPIEPLDAAKHDRAGFCCGVAEVDRYFQAVARQAADRSVAQTYVLVPSQPLTAPCEVIGYYTLLSHSYRDTEMDATTARALKIKNLHFVPTILLGQLGVAKAHQGKGVGSALLRDALRRSLAAALAIGAVAVITDPIDDSAERFFIKYGFRAIVEGKRRLLIPMGQLKKYNPEIVAAFKKQVSTVEITLSSQKFIS